MSARPARQDIEEALDLVVTAGTTLIDNGHTIGDSVRAIEGLALAYDIDIDALPTWTSLVLTSRDGRPLRHVPVAPLGVNMRVVTAVLSIIHRVATTTSRMPEPSEVGSEVAQAAQRSSYPIWLYALACATGATALAVIFGAVHPTTYVIVPITAAIGGLVRRLLGSRGVGLVGQAFTASLIGGIAGAVSIWMGETSAARLVAVCPAMVLVPGPHLLNGVLDLGAKRMSMGVGRLVHGTLIVLAISAGLILGLGLAGSLPVVATTHSVPLPLDVIAAMVAAASCPIYFALDARLIVWLIVWPMVAGAVAHGARWLVMVHLGVGRSSDRSWPVSLPV